MTMGLYSTPVINFSAGYRKRACSIDLPQSTAWLEHLELRVHSVTNTNANRKGSKVQYQVQATYTPPYSQDPELVWTVSRPFEAYRHFRKQLLQKLQRGHACPAECKWMYAVVKNHFPKPNLLPIYSARVVEARRLALTRLLRMIQASLINRGNQGCNVLVRSVCRAFTTFIVGDNVKLPDVIVAICERGSDQSTRDSSASFMSGRSDEEFSPDDVSLDVLGIYESGRRHCQSESGQ
ncbi:unnamed protein product [Hyaloperonospora brassicae]|uniref:PX domain-containing protein n=1 Tax=Hyaloperonospora brassicae TaxID=162125 RepID=A0AAV0TTE7_HYABA|nr:unnamed protein product [Hyaloperonospora brassicae]